MPLDTTSERIMYVGLFVAVAIGVIAAVIAALSSSAPTVSAARDIQPTPDSGGEPAEPADYERLSNPATRRGTGLTLAEIVAAARENAEALAAARLTTPEPVYLPEQPDELDDAEGDLEEAEPADEEQPERAPDVVASVSAVADKEAEVRAPFVIAGEPTEEALTYEAVAKAWQVTPYDENWQHSGMTGYLPRITDEVLAAEQARHDAAALLERVSAA